MMAVRFRFHLTTKNGRMLFSLLNERFSYEG